jgi:hypothetical protein
MCVPSPNELSSGKESIADTGCLSNICFFHYFSSSEQNPDFKLSAFPYFLKKGPSHNMGPSPECRFWELYTNCDFPSLSPMASLDLGLWQANSSLTPKSNTAGGSGRVHSLRDLFVALLCWVTQPVLPQAWG